LVLLIPFLVFCGCGDRSKPTLPDDGEPCFVQIDDSPVWSPDGQYIAYFHYGVTAIEADSCGPHNIDNAQAGIWIMNSDGTNPHLFVQGAKYPAWSSDSKWLVFLRGYIWKMKIDGDCATQLTFRRAFWQPDVAPYNDRVAVYNTLDDSAGIWITDFTGKDSLSYWGGGGGPRWHPSGDSLFYSSARSGYLIESLDRSGKRKIMGPLGYPVVEKIDFNSSTGMIVTAANGNISTFDINGLNLKRILTGGASGPVWSPNGQYIAYSGLSGGKLITLWVMKSDGSERRQLTFRGLH
jgi:TolB protein